jgi:anti-sigma factor RsiW
MVLSCKEVWRAVSDYIDGEVSREVRREIEAHLAQCRHCAALIDSTRNIVILLADDRLFAVPVGFSERLRRRLAAEIGKEKT